MQYYQHLEEIANKYGMHNKHLIAGDFNARLLQRLPAESENIGQHIFNPQEREICGLPAPQQENRDLFIEFCVGENYMVSSTFLQKNQRELMTYKSAEATAITSPVNNSHFAQLDFILTNAPWKNSVKDIITTHHTSIESDHKLLITKIDIKLVSKQKKINAPRPPRSRKPTSQQLLEYNEKIRALPDDRKPKTCIKTPTEQKQSYISEATWDLLQQRQNARESGSEELAKDLNLKIKAQSDETKAQSDETKHRT